MPADSTRQLDAEKPEFSTLVNVNHHFNISPKMKKNDLATHHHELPRVKWGPARIFRWAYPAPSRHDMLLHLTVVFLVPL